LVKHNIFDNPACFNDDGRVTAVEWSDFLLLNIYFPNGGDRADGTEMLTYKLNFYKQYQEFVAQKVKE
jgi:hypothetical protein